VTSHLHFIVLSYALGALILGWTAIIPVLRKRKLLAQLAQDKEEAR
jgi:heme exporter protein CcmD